MPVTLEQGEELNLVRLEGAIDIACAAELKTLLLQALGSKKELRVSVESATDLHATAMQLLWAAGRAARGSGVRFTLARPARKETSVAIDDEGFESFSVPVRAPQSVN